MMPSVHLLLINFESFIKSFGGELKLLIALWDEDNELKAKLHSSHCHKVLNFIDSFVRKIRKEKVRKG